MKTASVVFGALACPVSGSVVRAAKISEHRFAVLHDNLREALGGFSSDGQSSIATAKMFMGDLANKVAIRNYKTTDVDLDTVQSIKDFISDIETHAMAEHDEDQQLLQSAIDQIVTCGLIPQQTVDAHNGTRQDCENREQQHDECRIVENTLHAQMSDACKEYRDYRMHSVKPISNDCMPAHMQAVDIGADRVTKAFKLEKMEGCLVNSVQWLFPLHELYLKCKQAEGDHHERSENCTVRQEEYEACTCDYRAHLISGCEAHHDCHEEKVTEHNHIETQVKVREPTRKADHAAGEKIKCYFRVLTASQGAKQTILSECEGLVPDTSQFDIQYPVAPGIEGCPLPPSPCDVEWRNQHYLSQNWQAGAPVSECHECSASDPSHATLGSEWHLPTPVPTPVPTLEPTFEPTAEPTARPTPPPTNPTLPSCIALKSAHGKFVSADRLGLFNIGGGDMKANRDQKLTNEKFNVEPQGGNVYALKSTNGRYVCAEENGKLIANRDSLQGWEKFSVTWNNDGTIALKSHHGYYWFAPGGHRTGHLEATAHQILASEHFEVHNC